MTPPTTPLLPTSSPSVCGRPVFGRSVSGRRRPRATGAVLGLVLAATLVPVTGSATAAPGEGPGARKDTVDSALGALQEDLAGTSAELTDAYAEYAAVQEQLPAARRAAETARQEQTRARAQADDLAQRLAASRTARDAAAQTVAETGTAMAASRESIGRIAASSYRDQGVPDGLAVALDATSTDDLASRSAAVAGLSSAEADVLADLSSEQAVRASATSRLKAVTGQVGDLKAEAEQQLAAAAQAAQAAQARQADVETLVARQQQAVTTIEARQGEEQARLQELQAESDALGAQLRARAQAAQREEAARQAAEAERRAQARAQAQAQAEADQSSGDRASRDQGTQEEDTQEEDTQAGAPSRSSAPSAVSRSAARDSGSTLRRPEGRVTSPFGMRMHPIRGYMRMHSGVDIAAGCGSPIRAAEDGEIVSAGYNGSYGNITVVDHGTVDGQPVATAYPHMSSFAKTSGSVARGDILGYEGQTGAVTGCHLHFEVRVNGSPVDPMGWF